MLVIRSEQMQALEDSRFAAWLAEHVRRHFAERCLELGREATAMAIVDALARARVYGFRAPADLCRFVDMVFAFGPAFDRDAGLPWAMELLEAGDIVDPGDRMDLLIAAAKAHLLSPPGAAAYDDARTS